METLGELNKYLTRYSVENRWQITMPSNRLEGIDNVVVIPALDESRFLFHTLHSLSQNDLTGLARTLVICVVNNQSLERVPPDIYEDNQLTLAALRFVNGLDVVTGRRKINFSDIPLLNNLKNTSLRLAYVDASSSGLELPEKTGGVGLARKIGFDLALKVFDFETPVPKLLFSLDADTLVAHNYISAVRKYFEVYKSHAAVVAFAHQNAESEREQVAIYCYETFLRYYVLGLRYADASYAHYSIGSTFVCNAKGYIAVRGMNKRKAGEDFYFLNKMAKIGEIGAVNTTKVFPSARISGRAPFGTGRRVDSLAESNAREYLVYNPRTFLILREWLEYMACISETRETNILKRAREIHPSLVNFLLINRFREIWPRLVANSKDFASLSKHFKNWFDGFKIFKLIRYLTKNEMKPVEMYTALKYLLSLSGKMLPVDIEEKGIPPLSVQKTVIEYLRMQDVGE